MKPLIIFFLVILPTMAAAEQLTYAPNMELPTQRDNATADIWNCSRHESDEGHKEHARSDDIIFIAVADPIPIYSVSDHRTGRVIFPGTVEQATVVEDGLRMKWFIGGQEIIHQFILRPHGHGLFYDFTKPPNGTVNMLDLRLECKLQ